MLKKDRLRRKMRIRGRLSGTTERPRLSVYKSNKYIYAQVVDDVKGETLTSSRGGDAVVVGKSIAETSQKLKIKSVVFDRNGFLYHGRIKKLADAARESGLKF